MMKTYTLNLNQSQLSSLKVFLERTQLNGREVHQFVDIVQLINAAESYSSKKEERLEESTDTKISLAD